MKLGDVLAFCLLGTRHRTSGQAKVRSGDVTGFALVKTPAGSAVLVANHGDSLQAFTIRRRLYVGFNIWPHGGRQLVVPLVLETVL